MGLEGWPRAAVGPATMEVRSASGERGDGGADEWAALGVWCAALVQKRAALPVGKPLQSRFPNREHK